MTFYYNKTPDEIEILYQHKQDVARDLYNDGDISATSYAEILDSLKFEFETLFDIAVINTMGRNRMLTAH